MSTNAAHRPGPCAQGEVDYVTFTGRNATALFATDSGRFRYHADHMPRIACKTPAQGNSVANILRRRNAAVVVNVKGRSRLARDAIAVFRDDIIVKARYIETLLAARALPEAARAALMDIAELIGPFFAFMDRVCQVNKSLCSNRTFLLSFAPKLHADFTRRYEAVIAYRSISKEVLFAFGATIRLSVRAFGASARAALLLNSQCFNIPLGVLAVLIAVWSGGMNFGGILAIAQPLSSVANVMQTLANDYPAVLMMLLMSIGQTVPELMTWFRKEIVSHLTGRSGKAVAAQAVAGGAALLTGTGPALAIAATAIKMIDKMDTVAVSTTASMVGVNSSLTYFLNAAEGMWAASSPEARAIAIATGSMGALALGTNVPGYDYVRASVTTLFGARGGGALNMIRSVSAEINMPMTGTVLETAALAAGVRDTVGQYAGGVADRSLTKVVGSGWAAWTSDFLKDFALHISRDGESINNDASIEKTYAEPAGPHMVSGVERKKAEVKAIIMGLYEEQPAAFACLCAILAGVAGIAWATNVGDLAPQLTQNYRARIDEAAALAGLHGARISEALQQNDGIAKRAILALEAEVVRMAGAVNEPVERGQLDAAAKSLGANVKSALAAREDRLNQALDTVQKLAQEPGGLFGEKGRAMALDGAQALGRQIVQDEVLSKVNHIKTMWSSVHAQMNELKMRIENAKQRTRAESQTIAKIEADINATIARDLADPKPPLPVTTKARPRKTAIPSKPVAEKRKSKRIQPKKD